MPKSARAPRSNVNLSVVSALSSNACWIRSPRSLLSQAKLKTPQRPKYVTPET